MAARSSTTAIVKVPIGTFARSGLEMRFGADIGRAMQTASHHYALRLRSAQRPVGIPGFYPPIEQGEMSTEVDVSLENWTKAQLEQEAGRQGASLPQLLLHAALVYLADLDSPPARI